MTSMPAFQPPVPLPCFPSFPSPRHRINACTHASPPKAVMKAPKSFTPEDNVRPDLRKISPYIPIQPYEILAENLGRHVSDIVKLDANENPYGPSPTVAKALTEALFLHIYPDPASTALRSAIERYTSLSSDYILVGAGADELIDLLFRLFITPGAGDTIVNCPPTFGMYRFDADVNGCDVIDVPRTETFEVDVTAVEQLFQTLQKPPKMLFVTSPNNPDGSLISDQHLKRLLALPTLVILDEAYFEFADQNRILWVPQYDNLVVLRTFSKWAALAGMRVGYGALPLPIIKHLWKIKQPYNVSVASQIAATVSIHDKDDLLAKVDRLIKSRVEFYKRVANLNWLHPFPSQSNFVLCRVSGGGRNALNVKKALMDRGILIRYYSTDALSDCIRVSMGTEEGMERLYAALEEI